MKKIISLTAIALFLFISVNKSNAQATVPAAQALPYTQDFASLAVGTVTTYPAGWQGWQLSGSGSSGSFRTTAPTANLTMLASGSGGTGSAGVYNYTHKTGILASGSSDPSICLVVNTTGQSSVSVTCDIGTLRNPYNGSTETRRNNVELQYRLGNAVGAFTSLTGSIYRNNTTTQTTGTTPLNAIRFRFLLPAECDGQSAVQIRWVQRDSVGANSRPGFCLDNVIVCAAPTVTATVSPSCTGQKNGSVVLTISGGLAPYTVVWDTINTTGGPSYAVTAVTKTSQHPYFGVGFGTGYAIDGTQGKEITNVRGVTYAFNGTFSNHPFHISTSSVGGSFSNEVTSGTTNNFMQTGTLNFTPNSSHADSVWYQCGFHQSMGWKIRISNGFATQNLTNANPGIYTAAVKTADGCISNITVTIGSVSLPTISVSNNGPRCLGDSTALSSTGGSSYSWTGPNSFSSTLQNPKVFNATGGNGYYKVVVTNANGCTKKDSTNVSYLPSPTITVSNNGPRCLGDSTLLSSSGGGTYSWSGSNSFSSTLQNPKVFDAIANAGYYKVVVTNASGCTKKDSTQVTFLPTPSINSFSPDSGWAGDNILINGSGFTNTSSVLFNGLSATFIVNNDNQITATVPSGASTGKITVNRNNGCSTISSVSFRPLHYSALLLHVLLEGFYSGSGIMNSAVDPTNASSVTDSIIVQLYEHNTLTQPAFPNVTDVINRTGNGTFIFPENAIGNSYYIVVKSRNGIETWSKLPIEFSGITSFDFTTPE